MSVTFYGSGSPEIAVINTLFDPSEPEDQFNTKTLKVAVWGSVNISQFYAPSFFEYVGLSIDPDGSGWCGEIKGQPLVQAHNRLHIRLESLETSDELDESTRWQYIAIMNLMRLCIAYDSKFCWA